jgi:hypothetical protein
VRPIVLLAVSVVTAAGTLPAVAGEATRTLRAELKDGSWASLRDREPRRSHARRGQRRRRGGGGGDRPCRERRARGFPAPRAGHGRGGASRSSRPLSPGSALAHSLSGAHPISENGRRKRALVRRGAAPRRKYDGHDRVQGQPRDEGVLVYADVEVRVPRRTIDGRVFRNVRRSLGPASGVGRPRPASTTGSGNIDIQGFSKGEIVGRPRPPATSRPTSLEGQFFAFAITGSGPLRRHRTSAAEGLPLRHRLPASVEVRAGRPAGRIELRHRFGGTCAWSRAKRTRSTRTRGSRSVELGGAGPAAPAGLRGGHGQRRTCACASAAGRVLRG